MSEFINNHFIEITGLALAIGGGIKWLLDWMSNRQKDSIAEYRKIIQDTPTILKASADSFESFIDLYKGILDDCQAKLDECLDEKENGNE